MFRVEQGLKLADTKTTTNGCLFPLNVYIKPVCATMLQLYEEIMCVVCSLVHFHRKF